MTRTGPSKSFSAAHSFTLHSGGIATSKEKAREKPRLPLSLSVSGVKSRLGIPEQIQTPPGRPEPPRLQAKSPAVTHGRAPWFPVRNGRGFIPLTCFL